MEPLDRPFTNVALEPLQTALGHLTERLGWSALSHTRQTKTIADKVDDFAEQHWAWQALYIAGSRLPSLAYNAAAEWLNPGEQQRLEAAISRLQGLQLILPAEAAELYRLVAAGSALEAQIERILSRLQQQETLSEEELKTVRQSLYSENHFDALCDIEDAYMLQSVERTQSLWEQVFGSSSDRLNEGREIRYTEVLARAQFALGYASQEPWQQPEDAYAAATKLSDEALKSSAFRYLLKEWDDCPDRWTLVAAIAELAYYESSANELNASLKALPQSLGAGDWSRLLQKLSVVHAAYGYYCRSVEASPLFPNTDLDVIAGLRRQWDQVNAQLARVAKQRGFPFSGHHVCGDHLVSQYTGTWPVRNDILSRNQLLEGKEVSEYPLDGPPIVCGADGSRLPRITIFKCSIGTGHDSAVKGVTQSLHDCHVQVADIYNDILRHLDPGATLHPSLSFESIANRLEQAERFDILNALADYADVPLFFQSTLSDVLESYLRKEGSDMIISTLPGVNGMLLSAAKRLGIPLRIVATDVGLEGYFRGLDPEHPAIDYPHYHISYAYDVEETEELLGKDVWGTQLAPVARERLEGKFGYPLRRSFEAHAVRPEALKEIRERYAIQEDEQLLLCTLEGSVAPGALAYAEDLIALNEEQLREIQGDGPRGKLRLLCLCGSLEQKSNRSLQQELNALNDQEGRHPSVTIHAVGETSDIALLESLPEIISLISRPEGASSAEAVYKGIPALYHLPGEVLRWESDNVEYGKNKTYGRVVKMDDSTRPEQRRANLTEHVARSAELRRAIVAGRVVWPERQYNFCNQIRAAVQRDLDSIEAGGEDGGS